MSRVSEIIKRAEKEDRRLARSLRKVAVEAIGEFSKKAQTQQTGIFQVFRDNITEYPTRQNQTAERGGEVPDRDNLYNMDDDKKEKADFKVNEPAPSLSTRYSPDRVGVQARRIADGVYQDPYTNKIYDWHEGFTTEDGEKYDGGHVALQTDIIYR